MLFRSTAPSRISTSIAEKGLLFLSAELAAPALTSEKQSNINIWLIIILEDISNPLIFLMNYCNKPAVFAKMRELSKRIKMKGLYLDFYFFRKLQKN